MGRKKKPSAIRILEGNRGHRPIPEEPPKVEGEEICPSFLCTISPSALQHWERLAPELKKMGLLTKLNQGNLSEYCLGAARLEQWEKIIQKEGALWTGPDGIRVIHPLIEALDITLETQRRLELALFGLEPSSRAGLQIRAKSWGRARLRPIKEKSEEWGENGNHRLFVN